MRYTVIGSHFCPNTLKALSALQEAHISFDFKDISAGLEELKEFLAIRKREPMYEPIRTEGRIGIPVFVRPDGSVTRDLEEVLVNGEKMR